MEEPKESKKEYTSDKLKTLGDLRSQIDVLENEITENKRKEKILADERSQFRVIYKWEAAERPFSPKNKRWYLNVFVISLIVIVLSILTEIYMLIIATFAVIILLYALNTVPPMIFKYQITNRGIQMGDRVYTWRQIPRFWITERGSNLFINFETEGVDVGKLIVYLADADVGIIARELVQYIDYLTPSEVKSDFIMAFAEGRHKELGEYYTQDSTTK